MEQIDMAIGEREPLSHYLNLAYPYTVIKDDEAFFVEFPDLPGCMTQVEDAADIGAMAEEIRILWIETEYERGATIPEPVTNANCSGKFVVWLPKSLHRELMQAAEREGVSLNACVTYLLAERPGRRRAEEVELADTELATEVGDGVPVVGDERAHGRAPVTGVLLESRAPRDQHP